MLSYFLTLMLGIVLGGFLAYWFEDTLRGPILRAYEETIYGSGLGRDSGGRAPGADGAGDSLSVVHLDDRPEGLPKKS